MNMDGHTGAHVNIRGHTLGYSEPHTHQGTRTHRATLGHIITYKDTQGHTGEPKKT